MSIIVTLDYDPLWTALEWAKKNCPSYITNQFHKAEPPFTGFLNKQIDYYFGNDQDALIFTLRWK